MNRLRCFTTAACALVSIAAGALAQSLAAPDASPRPRDVPGSGADSKLQADIGAALARLEAKARPDCALKMQVAESCPIERSVRYAKMSQDGKDAVPGALREGMLHVETWRGTSCDAPVAYEVWLLRSPNGGTEIAAERLEAEQGAQGGAEAQPPATSAAAAGAPSDFQTYDGLKEQFTIEFPRGWHVVDQNAAMGRPGPYGVVLFSAEETGAGKPLDPNEQEAVLAALTKVATGEIASFLVERVPNQKGQTCAGYDKKALKKAVQGFTSPGAVGQGAKVVGEPTSEIVRVGGCTGVKVSVHSKSPRGVPQSLSVYTVSDGHTSFTIGLRAEDEYLGAAVPVFERAVASLKLTAAR